MLVEVLNKVIVTSVLGMCFKKCDGKIKKLLGKIVSL